MSEQAAESLKQEMEREIAEAQASKTQYLSDLAQTASSRPRTGGPESLRANATPEEPAMTVLKDKTLPQDTRVEVIQRLAGSISRRDDYIEALLVIVQDTSDNTQVREAALDLLGSAAFQVARFRPHQEAYDTALHNLVNDPAPTLRETAVSMLAVQHDPEVQQTLQQGLAGNGTLPVERHRAIQLLAEDDHLDNMPLLQELYREGDEDARQEAVRLMGSYPAAQTTLEGVLRNKGEATEVRQQSAASLRYLAPDSFEAIAKEIATDTTEDAEVRTACLSALQHLGNTERVYADAAFVQRVQDAGSDESAPQVAEAARKYVDERPT